jgi:hypothetical protein
MIGLLPVAPSVAVLRRITTSDCATDEARAKVDPPISDRDALVTNVGYWVYRL